MVSQNQLDYPNLALSRTALFREDGRLPWKPSGYSTVAPRVIVFLGEICLSARTIRGDVREPAHVAPAARAGQPAMCLGLGDVRCLRLSSARFSALRDALVARLAVTFL